MFLHFLDITTIYIQQNWKVGLHLVDMSNIHTRCNGPSMQHVQDYNKMSAVIIRLNTVTVQLANIKKKENGHFYYITGGLFSKGSSYRVIFCYNHEPFLT